jgi:ABC-type multidrug transport system fused ATPase/permease subunit
MNPETIYDHYKETCQLTKDAERARGRYLLFLVVVIAVLFLQIFQPEVVLSTIDKVLIASIGTPLTFSIYIIQVLIWFVLFGALLNYFQKCGYIERQYKYIHELDGYI